MFKMQTENAGTKSEESQHYLHKQHYSQTLNCKPDCSTNACRSQANSHSHHMMDAGRQIRDRIYVNGDDGYITDSRPSTTASLPSPLSSSPTSLNAPEGLMPMGTNEEPAVLNATDKPLLNTADKTIFNAAEKLSLNTFERHLFNMAERPSHITVEKEIFKDNERLLLKGDDRLLHKRTDRLSLNMPLRPSHNIDEDSQFKPFEEFGSLHIVEERDPWETPDIPSHNPADKMAGRNTFESFTSLNTNESLASRKMAVAQSLGDSEISTQYTDKGFLLAIPERMALSSPSYGPSATTAGEYMYPSSFDSSGDAAQHYSNNQYIAANSYQRLNYQSPNSLRRCDFNRYRRASYDSKSEQPAARVSEDKDPYDITIRESYSERPMSTSYVEDMTHSLTTIDEEDSEILVPSWKNNIPKSRSKIYRESFIRTPQHFAINATDGRSNKTSTEGSDFDVDSIHTFNDPSYYRAMPVTLIPDDLSLPLHDLEEDTPRANPGTEVLGSDQNQLEHEDPLWCNPFPQLNRMGLEYYSRFLEKDCEIPLRNIDPARRGKCSNINDLHNMDINRHIGLSSEGLSRHQRSSSRYDSDRLIFAPEQDFSTTRADSQQSLCEPENGYFRLRRNEPGRENSRMFASPDEGFCHNRGIQSYSRTHVMSSMPDLRFVEPSWKSGQVSTPPLPYRQASHHQHAQSGAHLHTNYPARIQSNPASLQMGVNERIGTLPVYSTPMETRNPLHNTVPCVNLDENIPCSSFENYPQVPLRRPLLMGSPKPCPKTTWQPRVYNDQPSPEPQQIKTDRNTLDLSNILQLQKQIRATSELCLQASRRHMFASSADIHKLFTGQIKPPASMANSCSFWNDRKQRTNNNVPLQRSMSLQTFQASPKPNMRLRLISAPSESFMRLRSPGPVRPDLGKHSLKSKARLTLLSKSEDDKLVFELQPQHGSMYSDLGRSPFHRRGSSDADVASNRLLLQRQSSGYSSETELQQIEFNAKAARNDLKKHGSCMPVPSPEDDNMSINSSVGRESGTAAEHAPNSFYHSRHHCTPDTPLRASSSAAVRKENGPVPNKDFGVNKPPYFTSYQNSHPYITASPMRASSSTSGVGVEPVYANQPILTRSLTLDTLNKSTSSEFSTPQTSTRSRPNFSPKPPIYSPRKSTSFTSSDSRYLPPPSQNGIIQGTSQVMKSKPTYSDDNTTQNQIIKLSNKPITITSHIPPRPYSFSEDSDKTNSDQNLLKFSGELGNRTQERPYSRHNYETSNLSGHFQNPPMYSQTRRVLPQGKLLHLPRNSPIQSSRNGSSGSSAQRSAYDSDHVGNVPFTTSIISNDQGNRLSTLV